MCTCSLYVARPTRVMKSTRFSRISPLKGTASPSRRTLVALGSKRVIRKENDSAEGERRKEINTKARKRRRVFGGWVEVREKQMAMVMKMSKK